MKKILIAFLMITGCAATMPLAQHNQQMLQMQQMQNQLENQITSMQPTKEQLAVKEGFLKYMSTNWGPKMASVANQASGKPVQVVLKDFVFSDEDRVVLAVVDIIEPERTVSAYVIFAKNLLGDWMMIGINFVRASENNMKESNNEAAPK